MVIFATASQPHNDIWLSGSGRICRGPIYRARFGRERKKMDILLIGAPGAGKGTQAEQLSQLLALRHIASGDLFHKAFEEQSELGLKAQRYVDLGELVPD